jgi:DNA mismatch repair protein MLH1
LRELASFYVPEALLPEPVEGDFSSTSAGSEGEAKTALEERRKHVHRALENVLFPAFKARLVATKTLLKGVVEVANLRGLYRVFERC